MSKIALIDGLGFVKTTAQFIFLFARQPCYTTLSVEH